MLRNTVWCCAAVALLAAATACSSSSTNSSSTSSTAPPTSAASAGAHTALTAMPTGKVVLTWDPGTKVVTAAVDLSGLTPGSSHAMHIHPGTCADQNKPPEIPFPDITADSGGVAKQTVTSQPVTSGIPTGAYVNVHLAPSATLGSPGQLNFTSIACGDIPSGTASNAGPVTVTMAGSTVKGAAPAGNVALSYDAAAHRLHVDLTATGLAANSAHAVHIHSGSCTAQGPVVYGLPDLKADGSGKATLNTTVDNVKQAPPTGGWYVNVHLGPMSQILADGNPTLLFAPILCANVTG